MPCKSPSPGERELEGGGLHPYLNPLPSRERNFKQASAVNHNSRLEYTLSCPRAYGLHILSDTVTNLGAGEIASRGRAVYSQEFAAREPDRLNLYGFTGSAIPPEPGNALGLHQCGDLELRQLYPQGVRQIDDLESKPFSLSMNGSPTIYGHDAIIFPMV